MSFISLDLIRRSVPMNLCKVEASTCLLLTQPDLPNPEGIKLFHAQLRQLRLTFILLINVKMPTIAGILTFMSRINY